MAEIAEALAAMCDAKIEEVLMSAMGGVVDGTYFLMSLESIAMVLLAGFWAVVISQDVLNDRYANAKPSDMFSMRSKTRGKLRGVIRGLLAIDKLYFSVFFLISLK